MPTGLSARLLACLRASLAQLTGVIRDDKLLLRIVKCDSPDVTRKLCGILASEATTVSWWETEMKELAAISVAL